MSRRSMLAFTIMDLSVRIPKMMKQPLTRTFPSALAPMNEVRYRLHAQIMNGT